MQAQSKLSADPDDDVCEWDTSQIPMRGFLRALPDSLEAEDPDFHSWWSQGFVMSRQVACAPTMQSPIPPTVLTETPVPDGVAPLTKEDKLARSHPRGQRSLA
eukprot:2858251-Prymnesium_polylepis.2